VKERENNLKHQQLISGVSLVAYWLSNGAMDIFKSLIPCGIAIAMIYAFDVALPHGWILILVYGFTVIPFTYTTSFFFTKENTAQTVSLLVNFFMGVILSPVFTMLHMFDNTRTMAKYLGWIFRIIPSFCLAYGSNNISYKEIYARLEYKKAGNDLDFSVAGGDLLFLCTLFPIYIILIVLIEAQYFNCLTICCDTKEPEESLITTQKSQLVIEEEKACDTKDLTDKPPAIMVKHLRKLYKISGSMSVVAVNDISFFINKGECLALLGTNGAGKTTTFKMITRDILPSNGEIFVNGMELGNNFSSIRKMIGYGPQYESAYASLTVRENLEFYAKIKGIPLTISREMILKLISEMDLIEYENILFGQLSGGNKRKTTAAIALLGNPPIVLLDELSTGVDPQAKRFMWHIIQRISTKNKNTAVILTTHSMEEAEYLCTKMAIMVSGSFCCIGTPQELKETFGKGFEIQVSMPLTTETEEREFLDKFKFEVNQEIEYEDIVKIFKAGGYAELEEQLKSKGNAAHIMTEIENKKTVRARLVASFVLTHTHAMEVGNELAGEFGEVRVPEWIGNFYKFRVNKSKPHHTIGFLFGIVQDIVHKYKISQYSASQTSLNQIFQTFAKQVEVIHIIKH
jgi:ATP-binding cassette subfamily A (ABC1) protein 3